MQMWTTADFDQMRWHDCMVHAFHGFSERAEFRFDIDYITAWVSPGPGETYFSFWIAPATLVFKQAHDLRLSLAPPDLEDFIILRVERDNTAHSGVLDFRIETLGGEIRLRASGFAQYLRAEPVLCRQQRLGLDERGGVSFATPEDAGRG